MTSSETLPLTWADENFRALEASLNGASSNSLQRLRSLAFQAVSAGGIPTPVQEEWKYTDLQELARGSYTLPDRSSKRSPAASELELPAVAGLRSIRISVPNGIPGFPEGDLPSGLSITTISQLLTKNDGDAEWLAALLEKDSLSESHPFASINTAFLGDGLLVKVAKGVRIQTPVEVRFLNSSTERAAHITCRLIILLEEGADLTVVESYQGTGEYLTTAYTQVFAERNSRCAIYRLGCESPNAKHVGLTDLLVRNDTNVDLCTFTVGGRLVRNEVRSTVDGAGAHVRLNGISVASGEQHIDNTTLLDHAKPHSESTEIYKGIYGERSRGVFSGTIIVRPDAQKTNAIQSNQTLLLSDLARIDSRPQLKIWADDVKCTHGATVGQLDQAALFYIRSRGVPEQLARNMLIHAFASDVIKYAAPEEIRQHLEGLLMAKLSEMSIQGAAASQDTGS